MAIKTEDGKITGKIKMYCKVFKVSRQSFYNYLKRKDSGWKYADLAEEMKKIHNEDEYNDTYGRERMYMALKIKKELHETEVHIPSEGTVRKVMEKIGLVHKPRRKPSGITKADKEARKSDDLIKRDFYSEKPLEKGITDISELCGNNGKLYVSVIFDCYDLLPLGISMDNNMKAELCVKTLDNAYKSYPEMRGMIIHSDRGSQYTSAVYRNKINAYGIKQSMNSAGGRCHDNARCESMWARMKEELFYSRGLKTEYFTIEELKTMIWRYFMIYWSNRRICTANGGLPPMLKRKRYYDSIESVA